MEQRFETFTALVTGISRAIRKIKNEEMVEFHLKGPHVSCLYYLYKKDALTAAELCDACEEDKANMSRTLDYLEKNGYIVCRATTARRYRARFSLSDLGKQVGTHIAEKIDRVLLAVGEGVSESERKTLYESLSRIHDNLVRVCESYEETKKGENE